MTPLNLDEIRNLIPKSTQLFLSTTITSQIDNYRQIIREELLNTIDNIHPCESNQNVLDLSQPPSPKHMNTSVSHCKEASGFTLINKPHLIGLDIEVTQRVSDKLIQRIAIGDEVNRALDPHSLLSAKEAAWKAINNKYNVPTISHIETTQWTVVTQSWSSYNISINGQSLNGIGFLVKQSDIYISFFIYPSTFV